MLFNVRLAKKVRILARNVHMVISEIRTPLANARKGTMTIREIVMIVKNVLHCVKLGTI